ncbi:hypothetical protein G6Z92_17405 [Vibrio aestuarianus subsp. cardii]|uniref:hypothetical protein n=1 Tax=Vibrio aestuarianus TaxID=28171 RepID=UPI0015C52B20|nr:hypothetical protein [Vibrio aestuarianus]NGZ68711.1 hypothetical protein [Vibrio aestuarianus subsp. cardii]
MNTKEMRKLSKIFEEWSLGFIDVDMIDEYKFYRELSIYFKHKNESVNFFYMLTQDIQMKIVNYIFTIVENPTHKKTFKEVMYIIELITNDLVAS